METDDHIPEGHALPGYQILDQIGQGGMSVVYRARHDALDRTVAIKFLTTELSQNPDDLKAFKFETQAAARINHPNLVQLHDAGELANRPYYVMEYISGANLGELISMRGKMEEEDALLIAEKVAQALRHCWLEHRLIHCDVKPENIIIDIHGKVKLTDLGLARIDGLTTHDEDSDLTVGTPAYMSPEQAMGLPDLDLRTDIYALGALLYHMVTGYRLFEGESMNETVQSQVHHAVEDVNDVNPGTSSAFAWMLERMLVKDRDHRYTSWDEVLTDLRCVKTKNMLTCGPFEPDISTMTRSETRETPPAAKVTAPSLGETGPMAVSAAGHDPKKIRISKGQLAHHGTGTDSGQPALTKYDPGRAFMAMLVVAVLTVVLYAVTYVQQQLQQNNAQPEPAVSSRAVPASNPAAPALKTAKVEKPAVAAAQPASQSPARPAPPPKAPEKPESPPAAVAVTPTATPSPAPPPPTKPKTVDGEIAWKNPMFVKAVRALEQSQQRYNDYLKNKGDARVLDAVERNCKAAIKVFESLEGKAPATAQLGSYSKKAYTLLANCQWTKQLL